MSDPGRKSPERAEPTFSDDIETICAQIGFDPKLYVEFPHHDRIPSFLNPNPKRAEALPGAGVPAPGATEAGSGVPPQAAMKQPPAAEVAEPVRMQQAVHESWPASVPAPAPAPVRPAPVPQPVAPSRLERAAQPLPTARPFEAPAAPLPPVERQRAVQGVRAGLRALLKELGGDDRPPEERPQRRARSIVVAPAISGMGCSTLTATLARYYQNRGEGVLIFDDREDGLLRLHFQAAETAAIPILSRDSAPTLAITWFEEPMTRHQMEYRWFLMDTKSITPALVNAQLSPGSCFLVPVLADMRGVKAAVRLSEQLDSFESEQGRRLAFYFVLNQFDRTSRLQEEMRQHLMRRLGGRLAPVAICWAEEVGAALAEGATVLDYAPDSPAARDFESLGEWLAGLG